MNNSSPNKNDNEINMTKDEKLSISKNYQDLKKNYNSYKNNARSEYDFYNLIEKSILQMEGEESSRTHNEEELKDNGMTKDDLYKICQLIRVLSMQLQRYKPNEWNEFLVVALDN